MNYKHKIVILDNSSLIKPSQKKCSSCKRYRILLDEDHQICHHCKGLSGNKVIDNFIKYTQKSKRAKMKFVPYYQFKNIEFIAEGGFSKIYKATWIGGESKIYDNLQHFGYLWPASDDITVALKKLNNSKNITSKDLNKVCTMFIY